MKGVDPKAETAKVAEPQPGRREALGERSGRQRDSRRNTNRPRGRARAMSVLENAKSHRLRKPCAVEPDDLARKFTHLTRGDLPCASRGEVSRGHSSEDAGRKARRAKGRRTQETRVLPSAPWSRPKRNGGERNSPSRAAQPSGSVDPSDESDVGGEAAGSPGRQVSNGPTAGCGKPHVRWCGSLGGFNPAGATRSTTSVDQIEATLLLKRSRRAALSPPSPARRR